MRTYPNPFGRLKLRRGAAFGAIIIFALLSFEIFNYSTTDFALHDLLGDLNFLGLRWSTILALAFCGIDFAGIARIFTPEQGADEPTEIWYLFGAWLLAATMNAALTWWGVSIAILQHETLGNAVVERATLLKVVPIFVALLVWLSRVLLIGTFSVAGERLFSEKLLSGAVSRGVPQNPQRAAQWTQHPGQQSPFRRPPPKPQPQRSYAPQDPAYEAHFDSRPEPTYHPVSLQGRNTNQNYRS
jgi:hypothetical protein